jgi:hypothetical protein
LDISLSALFDALASEIRKRIFANQVIIEMAQAIQHGEIRIPIRYLVVAALLLSFVSALVLIARCTT